MGASTRNGSEQAGRFCKDSFIKESFQRSTYHVDRLCRSSWMYAKSGHAKPDQISDLIQIFCMGSLQSSWNTWLCKHGVHLFYQRIFSKKGGVIGEPWFPIKLNFSCSILHRNRYTDIFYSSFNRPIKHPNLYNVVHDLLQSV